MTLIERCGVKSLLSRAAAVWARFMESEKISGRDHAGLLNVRFVSMNCFSVVLTLKKSNVPLHGLGTKNLLPPLSPLLLLTVSEFFAVADISDYN
jgi:hypothetical protein